MNRELYTVCPRCGKRAKIVSCRWDWDREETMARVKCICGYSEVSYEEDRVLDINLDNPYMKQEQFKLLIPVFWTEDRYSIWNKISNCLMASWTN